MTEGSFVDVIDDSLKQSMERVHLLTFQNHRKLFIFRQIIVSDYIQTNYIHTNYNIQTNYKMKTIVKLN